MGLVEPYGMPGIIMGQPCPRQIPYLLHYYFGPLYSYSIAQTWVLLIVHLHVLEYLLLLFLLVGLINFLPFEDSIPLVLYCWTGTICSRFSLSSYVCLSGMKVLSIFVYSPQIDLVLFPTVTLLTDELIPLTNIIVIIIIWHFLQSIICFLAVFCLQFLLLSCFWLGHT